MVVLVVSRKPCCVVGLVVEHEGGKPCLSGHVATYIPSCLGIVRVVPLPWIKVGNCGSCVRGDVPVEHL